MSSDPPPFRTGRELVTRFTGTLTERHGETVERIPTPQRFMEWLAVNGLPVTECSPEQWRRSLRLREAIHEALCAVAADSPAPEESVRIINHHSATGHAVARLSEAGGRHWVLGPPPEVTDALRVVAAEAIAMLSGERDGRLALCDSPTCREAFFDTSRSRTRRWCDMNICGNKQKKARLRATRSAGPSGRAQTSRTAP